MLRIVYKLRMKLSRRGSGYLQNYKTVHFLKRELFLMLLTYGVNKKKNESKNAFVMKALNNS